MPTFLKGRVRFRTYHIEDTTTQTIGTTLKNVCADRVGNLIAILSISISISRSVSQSVSHPTKDESESYQVGTQVE